MLNFLVQMLTFYDIKRKDQITAFSDTKIKSIEEDPDRKWITTWSDYLNDIMYFFRWLYNAKEKIENEYKEKQESLSSSDWETPSFVRIKKKQAKRLSPYLETELWERDDLLFITKYEPFKRNKAALTFTYYSNIDIRYCY